MEKTIKIQVIIGSTREKRFGERPAQYVFDELKKETGVEVELIDLRDWPLPFFDEPASPYMAKGVWVNPLGKKWAEKVAEADAYIIVTPEYNHGYPAVLKNALDWVFYEWKHKPVGFVSYGVVSGVRAVEQLRQVVNELEMHPIRTSLLIPTDMFFSAMMGNAPADNAEFFKPLREGMSGDRVKIFFDELINLARVLKAPQK